MRAETKKKYRIKNFRPCDFQLLAVILGLVVFGVIMVFSASYYQTINMDKSPYYYLIRDLVWAVSGIAIMAVFSLIDYHKFRKWAPWIFGVSILLLIMVFIPGLGHSSHGATRWISLGPITFMPGEFAKIAAIISVAWFLSEVPGRIRSLTKGVLPLVGVCILYGALILKQPNMSTAITVLGIIVLMMFIAGLEWKWLGAVGIMGVVGMCGLIFMDEGGYRLKRVTSFLDPFADPLGDGFQVVQSLLALGSGGLFGVGLGKSVQKNLYLPEPQNDFILAIIGEELGYIGVLVLIAAYVFLIWRGVHVALNAPDQLGLLLASGVVIMISLQVVLNIAVVTSSMPPTGVILPFISYGGNALWMFMASAGILLNVSRQTTEVK